MRPIGKGIFLAACATLLFTSGAAFAQGKSGGGAQGAPRGASSPDADRDRDMERDFDRDMDRDRDTDKDQDRLKLKDQDRDRLYLGTKDQIRAHDRDQDGKMDKSEFFSWMEEGYSRMDGDGNGLTFQEYQAYRLGPMAAASGNAAKQKLAQERALERKTVRFRLMDGDGDGIVSRAEYMNFGELNYLDADADDDGKLTFKELQQFHRGI